MAEVKEYVVYMTPIDIILLDWNDTLWKYGYPAFSKNVCREIARGSRKAGRLCRYCMLSCVECMSNHERRRKRGPDSMNG